MPTPTRAPTIDCVVDTGNPNLVAMVWKTPEPTSAQTMPSIRTPGEFLKGFTEKMPLRMVPVTLCPRAMAPVEMSGRCGMCGGGVSAVDGNGFHDLCVLFERKRKGGREGNPSI